MGAYATFKPMQPSATQPETQNVWSTIFKRAVKGLLIGAFVGLVAAYAINFAVLPVLGELVSPDITQVFQRFLTLDGAFSAVPLITFNGVLGTFTSILTDGKDTPTHEKENAQRQLAPYSAHDHCLAPAIEPAIGQVQQPSSCGHGQSCNCHSKQSASAPILETTSVRHPIYLQTIVPQESLVRADMSHLERVQESAMHNAPGSRMIH